MDHAVVVGLTGRKRQLARRGVLGNRRDEWHGTNAFFRDGDQIWRTYFVNNRGDEAMGSTWSYLDLTALGRQEEWEDYPQTPPYQWWDLHDEYGNGA